MPLGRWISRRSPRQSSKRNTVPFAEIDVILTRAMMRFLCQNHARPERHPTPRTWPPCPKPTQLLYDGADVAVPKTAKLTIPACSECPKLEPISPGEWRHSGKNMGKG